ncbi:MAG: hypothetical protein ABSH20_25915 [Tepidisphaeraceae bacterium]|jgi:hypothetical protein
MSTDLDHSDDRRFLAYLLVLLGVLYALLLGPQWSAGPDTAYYISIARSIAIGRGVEFNGGAVGRAPPGWPLLLAGLLRISSSFMFLCLCNLLMLLGSAAAWYRIVRRMVPPARAFAIVLLSGILYWWYCSTVQLRTEALFCVIFSPVVLLALQVAEGRPGRWRIALILLGCVAMVFVRFAGLAAIAVVVAALLTRLAQTRRNSLIVAVAVIVVTAVSFQATRKLITDILPQYIVPRPHMGEPIPGVSALDAFDREEGAPPVMTSVFGNGKTLVYAGRAASAGQWLAGYFWMPLHAANSNPSAAVMVNLFGWVLIGVVLAGTWQCGRQGSLLPLGAVLYAGSIIARWSTVNPRYLMPVAPLLLLAFWLAMDHFRTSLKSPVIQKLNRATVRLWIASLILANGALYAVDVFIARSAHFYYYYNGGELQQLASVSKYLLDHNIADGEVATNCFIVSTINKVRTNGYAHRGLVLLTDCGINVVPNNVEAPGVSGPRKTRTSKQATATHPSTNPAVIELEKVMEAIRDGRPDNPAVARFCQLRGIRYYVYRPPGSHAWHFRRSQLPSLLVGKHKAARDAPDWELYELINGKLKHVPFPLLEDWPRGVPCM